MNSTEAQVHQTSDKPDEHQENGHTCVRKRTRATTEQLSVLESAFAANISPNTKLRKQLAEELQMSQRSIQIWFQNRRAKVKQLQKKAQMQMEQAAIQAQLQHYHQQQQQQQYNMMASFGVAHPPYPQQCQFQQQSSPQPFCFPPHCATVAPLVRAQSMDTVISYHGSSFSDITALSSIPTPGPEPYIAFGHEGQEYTMIIDDNNCGAPPPMYDIVDSSFTMSRRNMPSLNRWTNTEIQPICKRFDECLCSHEEDLLQDQNDFPDYIDGQISPSPSPSARFSSRYNSSSSSFSDENKLNLFETSDYNESSPTEDSKEKTPHLSSKLSVACLLVFLPILNNPYF
jgi:hypothetical protein